MCSVFFVRAVLPCDVGRASAKKIRGFWSKPRTMQCFLIGLNYWARVIWKTAFGVRATSLMERRYIKRRIKNNARSKRRTGDEDEKEERKWNFHEMRMFWRNEKSIMIKMGMKKPRIHTHTLTLSIWSWWAYIKWLGTMLRYAVLPLFWCVHI